MTVFRRTTTRLLTASALAIAGAALTATPASAVCNNLTMATGPDGPVSTSYPPTATVQTVPIGGAATLRARLSGCTDGVAGQTVRFFVYTGTHAGQQVSAVTDTAGWATATVGSDQVADDSG